MEYLALKSKELKIERLEDIVFFESEEHFTITHYYNGLEYLIDNKLNQVEDMLSNDKFFRINSSIIINADYLRRINVSSNKNVLLCNGIEQNIAKDRYADLIKFLRINYKPQ